MRLVALIFLLTSFTSIGQDRYLDSLKAIVNDPTTHDTVRVKALSLWDGKIYISDPDLDMELNLQMKDICMKNLQQHPTPSEKRFYEDYLLRALNVIGISYTYAGDYAQAITHFLYCLKLHEKNGDTLAEGNVLNNIGVIHDIQENYDDALSYFERSLEARKAVNDVRGIATTEGNIANIYFDLGENEKALEGFRKALAAAKESGFSYEEARALNNMGRTYYELKQFDSCRSSIEQSMAIREQIGDYQGLANSYLNYGNVLQKFDEDALARDYYRKSFEYAEATGATIESKESSAVLYLMYKEEGKFYKALEMYEYHISLRDSLNSEENHKAVIQQQLQYEYEKQQEIDALEEKAREEKRILEREKEAHEKYGLYAVLGLVLILGGVAFRSYLRKKRDHQVISEQKAEVELQKNIVEEQHEEIMDSIAYAKRIQNAILPPERILQQYLPEHFVFYLPKDVVAGDFYWLEAVENGVLIAAADCTGHGVPGALVSVICNNALNRSVREYGFRTPGQILDKAKEIVIQEFEKSDDEVKDGMDIALCSLSGEGLKTPARNGSDSLSGNKNATLQYAGAHNPLWVVRNSEIIEYKANKQPVGKFEPSSPFTTHDVELQAGDTVYIFSDGYVDQFGGDKGKKFKSKNLKDLLLSMQSLSMKEQQIKLNEAFIAWKGDMEQVDDVCVIGIRL